MYRFRFKKTNKWTTERRNIADQIQFFEFEKITEKAKMHIGVKGLIC